MAQTKKYDLEKIRQAYEKSRNRTQAERYSYERVWFRNILFFLGIQWIVYSPQTRKWQPRKISRWVPRPVTNKFAVVANTIMQVLSSKEPEVRCVPGTDDADDQAAARVADRNFDVILDDIDSDAARSKVASWLTLTGNVILHSCYDKDKRYGTSFVQHLQCADCKKTFSPDKAGGPVSLMPANVANAPAIPTDMEQGVTGGANALAMPLPVGSAPVLPAEPEVSESSCPFCQSPNVQLASDETGKEVGEEFANGRNKLEVFSPFEVYVDLEARSMDEVQELLVRRRYPVSTIRELYGKPELEADNNSNVGGTVGLNLLRAIAYASGNAMYGTGVASGRNLGDDQSITVDMLWKRPCEDFPDGLVAVYANEKLLNDGKGTDEDVSDGIPYRSMDGRPIWPWQIINFDEVPGRIFGKTPLDDVAPKQEQRNKLESLIQLIITRMASPQWLVAKGLGVTEFTGEPGQVIEGNWQLDPRLMPQRVPGENVPTSVVAWLEKIDKDIEELAGTFEVLRGAAPAGVTAGTALRLLLERATTRFTPVIRRFEVGWQKAMQDQLTIFQQFGTEERINRIQGEGNTWEVERFSRAEVNGSIDVRVEAGSAVPKSSVGEQALIQDLTAGGVINPTNPETQYKILEKFSSTSLLGETDLNIRQAQRENYRFIKEDFPPTVNPVLDSHMAHIQVHKQYALTSDFENLPEDKKRVLLSHILQHQMMMMPPMPGMGIPSPLAAGLAPATGTAGGVEEAGNGSPTPSGEPPLPPQQTPNEESQPPLAPGV